MPLELVVELIYLSPGMNLQSSTAETLCNFIYIQVKNEHHFILVKHEKECTIVIHLQSWRSYIMETYASCFGGETSSI